MDTTPSATADAQIAPAAKSRTLAAEDWRYLYMVTGFALVLEGILVEMILDGRPPANLLIWLVLGALTVCLTIYNPFSRDALLRAKERFESEHGA